MTARSDLRASVLLQARARLEQGDWRAADNFAAMVLEKWPHDDDAWLIRAQAAHRAGNRPMAQKWLDAWSAVCPQQALPWALKASLLREQGDIGPACMAYQEALSRAPHEAAIWVDYAHALADSGAYAEAIAAAEQALAYAPEAVEAQVLLGGLLHGIGQTTRGLPWLERAVARAPHHPLAWNNLGVCLEAVGQHAEAVMAFKRALDLVPGHPEFAAHLAGALQRAHRYTEAIAAYDVALNPSPRRSELLAARIFCRMQALDWPAAGTEATQLQDWFEADPTTRVPPFIAMSLGWEDAAVAEAGRRWSRTWPTRAARPALPPARDRFRIGYFGADFHTHATAFLIGGLFAAHDHAAFEVFVYDYGPDDGSAIRQKLKSDIRAWRQISPADPSALISALHADALDLLIDLKGWTEGSRFEWLAARPVPLVAHYLGFPGPTGAPWCDYLIADPVTMPPEQATNLGEAVAWLPGSYQINDHNRPIAPRPSRTAVGLPDDAFVCAAFCQPYKLHPNTLQQWARLIDSVPHALLWLLDPGPALRDPLFAHLASAGIGPTRVRLAPALPQAAHLARLQVADLVLDTHPVNGHTSTGDALWAGVPVVTYPGKSFAGRVTASCLKAMGLDILIAADADSACALAIRLAQNPCEYQALRRAVEAAGQTAPLFDTAATTRALESAYRTMIVRHRAGQAPTSFKVSP